MSLEYITKIESSAKDLAIAAQTTGNQSVASDLEKIIKASTIFNNQITQLNSEPGQNDTLQSALNNGQIRHDLRTPLVAILGYSEMLIEDSDEIDIANFKSIMAEMHAIAAQLLLCIDEHSDQLIITSVQNNKTTYATEQVNDPGTDLLTTLLSFTQLDQQVDNEQLTGKILIVDDHAMNCEVLTRYVERQGHSAVAVLGGHEAIKTLREDAFDVLLLDLHMPNMNGYEVLQIMQSDANLRHIPVIMISAIDEIDKVVKCIELGAQDYLPKPINQVLLKARIGASLQKKRLHDMEILHLQQVKAERSRADDLLKVIFPAVIAEELKATKQVKPRRHENVAVFFLDLVGFTEYCNQRSPEQVVTDLQKIFHKFEDIALKHKVDKTKTIGDAFMATAGLLSSVSNPVLNCVNCGLEMIAATKAMGQSWNARVGIHIGPVVSGVVGKRQYLFDVWGDTVNTAARIESNGQPGYVYLSSLAWQSVRDQCTGDSIGEVAIKGKGNLQLFKVLN